MRVCSRLLCTARDNARRCVGYFGRQASCQLPKGAPDEVQLLSVAPNAASFSVAFTSSTKRTVTATLHIPSSSGVSPAASPSSSSSSSASSPASSAMSLEEEDADSLVHADDPIFTLVAGEQLSKLQAAYDKQVRGVLTTHWLAGWLGGLCMCVFALTRTNVRCRPVFHFVRFPSAAPLAPFFFFFPQ